MRSIGSPACWHVRLPDRPVAARPVENRIITMHKPFPETDLSALFTVRKVAELDDCSEKTVRRAIKAGLLEVVRIGPGGRLLRVRPEAHEAYRSGR
jgi:hypothetical protein